MPTSTSSSPSSRRACCVSRGERYWMLETIREYGEERARDSMEIDQLGRRHRAWFVELAEQRGIDVLRPDPTSFTAAKRPPDCAPRCRVREHPPGGCACTDLARARRHRARGWPLFAFLIVQGHGAEAREWVDAALAQRDFLSPPRLAAVLVGGGEIVRFGGNGARAAELKREALELIDDVSEFSGWIPHILADLCDIALDDGDFELAREYAAQSAAAGGGVRAAASLAEVCLRAGDLSRRSRTAWWLSPGSTKDRSITPPCWRRSAKSLGVPETTRKHIACSVMRFARSRISETAVVSRNASTASRALRPRQGM